MTSPSDYPHYGHTIKVTGEYQQMGQGVVHGRPMETIVAIDKLSRYLPVQA